VHSQAIALREASFPSFEQYIDWFYPNQEYINGSILTEYLNKKSEHELKMLKLVYSNSIKED
jgi:hypothetical protein